VVICSPLKITLKKKNKNLNQYNSLICLTKNLFIMKKILLFVAGLMLAMSANAATTLYLRGAINSWNNIQGWEFTETSAGVFELVKDFNLSGEFKIADKNWTPGTNFGAGDNATVSIGVALAVADGSNTNFNVPAGTNLAVSKIVFDMNAGTMTIFAEEKELVDDFAYFLHGDFQVKNDWQSTALIENDGIWSISDFVVVNDPANFGVKRENNAIQDAWYWVADGGNVSAAGEYQFGEEKSLSGANPQISAGTYTISFDPETLIMTVTPATATDLEDVDAEDAVVAAFDITGKPVAADAKGIVILQYASGKAAKVFNN
jgi:hypothetical protein